MTINELLVKRLSVSYEEALQMIQNKNVFINGIAARQRQEITTSDKVVNAEGNELQTPVAYQYVLYHKPRGVECTLNPEINNNLREALPFAKELFPVGRLDKESEGLLLLTNDGALYKRLAGSEVHQEKEYEVEVDSELTDTAIQQLITGVEIMGKKTRPAIVSRINEKAFRIVLTQGLNRQIRRMCYKLGYQVTKLKRIRIASFVLGNLKSGEFRSLPKEEVYTFKLTI